MDPIHSRYSTHTRTCTIPVHPGFPLPLIQRRVRLTLPNVQWGLFVTMSGTGLPGACAP